MEGMDEMDEDGTGGAAVGVEVTVLKWRIYDRFLDCLSASPLKNERTNSHTVPSSVVVVASAVVSFASEERRSDWASERDEIIMKKMIWIRGVQQFFDLSFSRRLERSRHFCRLLIWMNEPID